MISGTSAMLRTIANVPRMCGLAIQHTQGDSMIRRLKSDLRIPFLSSGLNMSCKLRKRHFQSPANIWFRSISGATGQTAERDETCTGYVCEKREVGLCACSNDRAKRDRERRKLSPVEIKVSSTDICFLSIWTVLSFCRYGMYFGSCKHIDSNEFWPFLFVQKRCAGCAVFPCSEHEYPDADCEEQRACEAWFDDDENK
jgi:hypothetical protein